LARQLTSCTRLADPSLAFARRRAARGMKIFLRNRNSYARAAPGPARLHRKRGVDFGRRVAVSKEKTLAVRPGGESREENIWQMNPLAM